MALSQYGILKLEMTKKFEEQDFRSVQGEMQGLNRDGIASS